jgi:mono/diheme cytochrome c family protein
MNKLFFAFLSLVFMMESTSSAAVYKGQRIYVKDCRECHGGGQAMAASKKARDWKKLLQDEGKSLAEIHTSSQKAKDSWEYFNSDAYESQSKDLKDFLIEYSKDSGKVPACN